jgi:CTP synthase (UTP-ammonia lyase)
LPDSEPQDAIAPALQHAASEVGVEVRSDWFGTVELETDAGEQLAPYDAIWCAPGSPFRSMGGALEGIRVARESGRPFLGTCAGFQHAVIELARNALGRPEAQHAEYDPLASDLFISELTCSLRGQTLSLQLVDPAVQHWYGATAAVERYYCSFGLNPEHRTLLHDAGLRVVAIDGADGDARIMQLDQHPFFVITLFVPQTRSTVDDPHPIISAFVRAADDARRPSANVRESVHP